MYKEITFHLNHFKIFIFRTAIRAIVTELCTKFTLLDIKPPTRLRRERTEENIATVSASVNDDHQLSMRRRSQQLGLC